MQNVVLWKRNGSREEESEMQVGLCNANARPGDQENRESEDKRMIRDNDGMLFKL